MSREDWWFSLAFGVLGWLLVTGEAEVEGPEWVLLPALVVCAAAWVRHWKDVSDWLDDRFL